MVGREAKEADRLGGGEEGGRGNMNIIGRKRENARFERTERQLTSA